MRYRYRTDEALKDSGIEWLGRIPVGWEKSLVKYFYNVTLGKMLQPQQKSEEDTLEKYLCSLNIDWQGVRTHLIKQMWFSKNEKIRYKLQYGDLVVNEGGDAGKATIWKEEIDDCYIQNAVHRVRGVNQNRNKFLYYWLFMLKSIQYIELICNKATIMHFTAEKFNNLLFLTPTLPEQQKIATFLDQKTGEFDTIIAQKGALIQKLEEGKKALISEVVTGKKRVSCHNGVWHLENRPESELKESGIEWLGRIPVGWEVSFVKYFYNVTLGKMLQPQKKSEEDTLEKYLCSVNVDWKGIRTHLIKEMWFSKNEKERYKLQYGDLVVNEGGDAGKATIWKDEIKNCYIQNAVHCVRGLKKNNNKFLYYWLFMLKSIKYIELICNKATIMHFTAEKFNNLLFLLTTLPEQQTIANFLDHKTEQIDETITQIKGQIEKLKEAKQALISEAVTGKIEIID